jgi:hypothetical protein
MCELTRITKRKSAIIYKAVEKDVNGNYYSYFAGLPIKLGKVDSTTRIHTYDNIRSHTGTIITSLPCGRDTLAIGRTMGVIKLSVVKQIFNNNVIILKMEIGGSIAEGMWDKNLVLAGTEIISFKEVKI